MCNAYSLSLPRQAIIDIAAGLAEQLDLPLAPIDLPEELGPRYRYSPRQLGPVLRLDAQGRLALGTALWGLTVKGGRPGFAPTNARDDKLVGGWPWKLISRAQRCLVPADGFFEPDKPAGDKSRVPWSYYCMGNRQPFFMAGLINEGPHPKTGETIPTFTVVTTGANATIRLHDRMPVIIEEEEAGRWITPSDVPQDLLRPYASERMTGWQVADDARNSRLPDHQGMTEPRTQQGLFD